MNYFLEQEESINFLKRVHIVPQRAYIKILDEENTRNHLTEYKIEEIDSVWNRISISYALNMNKDEVTYYSVYASSDNSEDILCICKSEDGIYNSLFDNILMLEEYNWKHCILENNPPITHMEDYKSFMFSIGERDNYKIKNILYDTIAMKAFLLEAKEFADTSKLVSKEIWQKFAI